MTRDLEEPSRRQWDDRYELARPPRRATPSAAARPGLSDACCPHGRGASAVSPLRVPRRGGAARRHAARAQRRPRRLWGDAVVGDGRRLPSIGWWRADAAGRSRSSVAERSASPPPGCCRLSVPTSRSHARALPPETTSNVAGALWYPHLLVEEARRTAAFDALFESAARFSRRYFQSLVGDDYGVCWRQQGLRAVPRCLDSWDVAFDPGALFLVSRQLRPGEHPFGAPHVVLDRMMFIDPAVYLEALLRDFRLAGGRVRMQSFASPADVAALPERIVMNCTGLGARDLFGDRELMPVKGQLTVVLQLQPEIDYAMIDDEDLYMFPRRDGILLGGTHEPGSREPRAQPGRRTPHSRGSSGRSRRDGMRRFER